MMEHISVGISKFMQELDDRRFSKWCDDNIEELKVKWEETGREQLVLIVGIEQMLREEYNKYLESMLPKEKKV